MLKLKWPVRFLVEKRRLQREFFFCVICRQVYNICRKVAHPKHVYRKCPNFRKSPRSALSTSMSEENCSYFKNIRNTHLLDEHINLPGCEIVLNIWQLNKILTENKTVLPRLNFSQPQITCLFYSEFQLQLFHKSVSKSKQLLNIEELSWPSG